MIFYREKYTSNQSFMLKTIKAVMQGLHGTRDLELILVNGHFYCFADEQ